MPKYIVQHTPILHGEKEDKKAARYEVGGEIELADKDAQKLGDNVALTKTDKKETTEAEAGKEKEKKKQQ